MRIITVKEIEYIAFKLAQEMLSFNEPIPNFSTRFPNILESSLATPFQSFGKKSLYPSLLSKSAILFYFMIKNHPFQNGNKRIAMTTLFVFLYKNKKWLKVDTQELYNFTVWIAQSPPKFKEETVSAIEKFLRSYMVDLTA
jgi:death-on-curing family protein